MWVLQQQCPVHQHCRLLVDRDRRLLRSRLWGDLRSQSMPQLPGLQLPHPVLQLHPGMLAVPLHAIGHRIPLRHSPRLCLELRPLWLHAKDLRRLDSRCLPGQQLVLMDSEQRDYRSILPSRGLLVLDSSYLPRTVRLHLQPNLCSSTLCRHFRR
jgi:hypothetical protein